MVDAEYWASNIASPIGVFYGVGNIHCMAEESHGARIRRLRKAKGWTQVDMEEASGVDQASLSGIENGAEPKWETLGKIAAALGTTRDYIMEGRDDQVWPFRSVTHHDLLSLDLQERGIVEGEVLATLRRLRTFGLGNYLTADNPDSGQTQQVTSSSSGTTESPARQPGPADKGTVRMGSKRNAEVDRHGKGSSARGRGGRPKNP